jgi:raffinose/stachyose/melibiose transport system substrate-binding protein
MKRIFSILAIFALVCLPLMANGSSEQSSSKEKVSLWAISSGENIESYEAAFGDIYQDFDYEFTSFADDDLKTQSKIALDSGNVPSTFQVHAGSDFAEFYNSGLLVDITDLIKETGADKKISAGYFGPYSVDGKIYGVPASGITNWQTLYVNKDLFKQAGISEYPRTIPELIETSKILEEAGIAPIAIGNKDEWPAVILFGDYYAQQEEDLGLVNDIMSGKKKFTNSETMKKSLETIVKLGQESCYMPGFSSTDMQTAIQVFAAGKAAMLYCGTWWTGIVGGVDQGFDVDVFQLPLIEGLEDNASVQLCADTAMVFTSDTSSEAIKSFIEFFITDEFWKAVSIDNSAYAIIPEVNDMIERDPLFESEPIIRQFDKPVLSPFFDWVFPTEVTSAMKTNFQLAISGTLSVDEALTEIQKVMDQNLVH